MQNWFSLAVFTVQQAARLISMIGPTWQFEDGQCREMPICFSRCMSHARDGASGFSLSRAAIPCLD